MNDVYTIFQINNKADNKRSKYKEHTKILSKYLPLKKLIETIGPIEYEVPIWSTIEDAILYAVIGQMLSIKAASSIIKRLIEEFGDSKSFINWAVTRNSSTGPAKGVSSKKIRALREWTDYASNNFERWNEWKYLPLNEYRKEVLNIWGFGRWASDMIAIFHLGRMDIWPENDIGLKKASENLFGKYWEEKILEKIKGSETVAALYLWKAIDSNYFN